MLHLSPSRASAKTIYVYVYVIYVILYCRCRFFLRFLAEQLTRVGGDRNLQRRGGGGGISLARAAFGWHTSNTFISTSLQTPIVNKIQSRVYRFSTIPTDVHVPMITVHDHRWGSFCIFFVLESRGGESASKTP